ncbi:MAG: glycerophosphodiester phosphodiesterase family protein [Jhaorihella sp.]
MTHFAAVIAAYRDAWGRRWLFAPLYLSLRLLVLALVAPGVAALINVAVSLSDQSALTDQDIALFILSPVGFVAALTVLSVFLLAEVLSFSVMAASLRVPTGNVWAAGRAALALVLRRAWPLWRFALRFLLRVLVLVAPFAAMALIIAWWTLTKYDINYYLTFHPPAFVVATVLIGLLLLALAFVLIRRLSGWALALHLVLFDGAAPGAAFGQSEARMRGRHAMLRRRLVLWLVVRLALGAAIAALTSAIVSLLPDARADNLPLVLWLGMAVVLLSGLAAQVVAATALGGLAILLDGFLGAETPPVPAPATGSAGPRGVLLGGLVLAAVALLAGGWVGERLLARVAAPDDVEVIGHRGAAGTRPENTMASVNKAIEDGVDWVEIDVQETADGEILVIHDSDFMKLAGNPVKAWEVTMDDVAGIDIGSWFADEFADQRAPTLREVLAAADGKAKVLIELKYYGHDVDLENRVAAIVDEFAMGGRIALMSLKYPAVQKVRAMRPGWRAGVLAATAVGDLSGLEADFVAVSAGMASPGLIRRVQASGKDIYVWTDNDPLQMSQLIAMGVDGLITDRPALVREVLAFRASLGPAERLLLWLSGEFDLGPRDNGDGSP